MNITSMQFLRHRDLSCFEVLLMQLTPTFAHRHMVTVHREPDNMLNTLDRSQQSCEMGCVITLLLLTQHCGQWRFWPKVIEGAYGEVQSPFWAFCLQGMYKNHCTGSGHLGRLWCCSWGKRMIIFSFKEFPICLTFAHHH